MDPSGQGLPGGGPMGHSNMRQQGVPPTQSQQPYPQNPQPTQHQNMLRPQVQQYINRPSPSYQGQQPPPQQMPPQFQRAHNPYQQQQMPPGHSQGPVGSPHQMNVAHRQQQPPSNFATRLSQPPNSSQFSNVNQGSPLPQQVTGSPYQMIHSSPAMAQRYNSPQMPPQSHQQIPPHQMQASQMQNQQYQQQQMQHQQPQMPPQQRYQQMQNPQSQNMQQYPGQKQIPSQQQYQMQQQQPSPNQMFQHHPSSSLNTPQLSSQPLQFSGSSEPPFHSRISQQMNQQPPPIINQPRSQLASEMASMQNISTPPPLAGVPEIKDPNLSKSVLPHPVVARLRLSDPRKNLLMQPKTSVLKSEKNVKNEGRMEKSSSKKVRWASNLRIRRTPRSVRKTFKPRALAPSSPPLIISGEEAEIAQKLIQPLYHGELVIHKRKRIGMPPIRARLIGGKISKSYSKSPSIMLAAKRRSLSKNILRRMALERSFTIRKQIECGEKAAEYNKDSGTNEDIPISQEETSQSESNKPAYIQPSNIKGIMKPPSSTETTMAKHPVKSSSFYKSKENVPFRRTFFHLPIKKVVTQNPGNADLTEEEKKEREETIQILNNIPWRTLPKKSDKSILPRIWHPPIIINKGWIVLDKTHHLCRPIPIWHPPLSWPPKTFKSKNRKIFKIDGPIIFKSSNNENNFHVDDRQKTTTIQFALPVISQIILLDEEIDDSKIVFNPNAKPSKTALKPFIEKSMMEIDGTEVNENIVAANKNEKENTKKRNKSPSLVNQKYIKPNFRIPSLSAPPPPTKFPTEPQVPIDLTKNPFYNPGKPMTYLSEQKTVFLSAEYRVAQLRETQPKNMWDLNNQKMIDLMKTKGAGIDSTIREDAGKALKILEEKASKAIGKHSEIRNKLFQFCVNFGFEHAYEENHNYFYLKNGDFTVQFEIQDYYVKNAWYFWNNIEPFPAPTIAALLRKERWSVVSRAINRMRNIIPTSLTSEEKDLLLRALSCMERDLQRYHEKIEWRSHLFALNDMIVRTDINPFSIILPRSPIEIMQDEARNVPIIDKFEKCRNLVILQIQISPLERHKFCIQSSLTPQLRWSSPDSYKVGARFMIKLAYPMPIRYGAIKQLENIVSGIISKENYINAYKNISQKLHHKKDILLNLSDYSKKFFMYFHFDQFDIESKNDALIDGFYIDKASQFISAMYIIKREYILNKLCEGTCEKNINTTEYRYAGSKATKTAINIRLADVCDGHVNLYFQYRCYLAEIKINVTPNGNVTLGDLKIVHHGHKINSNFYTAAGYQSIIYEFRNDSIILNQFQMHFLNDVIQKTWHLPHLIDETIKCLKSRCAIDNNWEPHEFYPTIYADTNYKVKGKKKASINSRKSKNSQILKSIYKRKRESRVSCNPKIKPTSHDETDKDDPSNDDNNSGNQKSEEKSKNLERRSSGKSSNNQSKTITSTVKNESQMENNNLTMKQQYLATVKQYFKWNINNILKHFEISRIKQKWFKMNRMVSAVVENGSRKSSNKFKKLHTANILKRFYLRRQNSMSQKMERLEFVKKAKTFQKRNIQKQRKGLSSKNNFNKFGHGAAWNNFVTEINEDIIPPSSKSKNHTLITWPMLADQRVTLRYSNTTLKHKNDPQMDEAGKIEEMDEFFNLSDCEEENEQVCSYSTIQRKIIPALSRKSSRRNNSVTLDDAIGTLKPQFRKYLLKYKLDKNFENEKSPNNAEANPNIKWGEDWKQEDFIKIYEKEKNAHQKKIFKNKTNNYLARPTALRFISMLNREKPISQGLFPCKILRHAAICLRDGPYRASRRKRSLPKSLIARYKRKFARSFVGKQRRMRWLKKKRQLQEAAEKLQQEQMASGQPASAELRSRSVPRLKSLIRRKKLILPPPLPPPPLTPSQIENHKRLILYFDHPAQSTDGEVYVEDLRSRLMAIWIYFKPFIRTARAFERMLELYGPEAIYNQLQSHRRNLLIENNLSNENRYQQAQQRHLQYQAHQTQQYHQQRSNYPPPTLATMHSNRPLPPGQQMFSRQQIPSSSGYFSQQQLPPGPNAFGSMPHPIYDAQNQFNYNPQDMFGGDSSSSSALSTPTNAGPLQSPFTPNGGKRRGRGRRVNTGSRTPSDQQLMGSDIPKIFEARRGRPRKPNPNMTPTSYSMLESPSQESPQMMQSSSYPPQHPYSMNMPPNQQQQANYNQMPQQQNMPNMYPMNTMATTRPNNIPSQLQPSPLATQSLSTPQKTMQQQQVSYTRPVSQSHQNYDYESTSDEETDPPRPPPREPIKLKVDMTKVTVKPIETKTSENLSETISPDIQKVAEETSIKSSPEKLFEPQREDEESKMAKEKDETERIIKEKEKEREKQRFKDKERVKEREKKKSDETMKLQKSDKNESERQKSKNKESKKPEPKSSTAGLESEADSSNDSLPPPPKKMKTKVKSPEPTTSQGEKEKKEPKKSDKREREKDREREKHLVEYEEERAKKKLKTEQREDRDRQEKEKLKKGEKLEKLKTMKVAESESEKRKEKSKDKPRNEKEKLEKLEKEKLKKREDSSVKGMKSSDKEKLTSSPSMSPMPASGTAGNLKKRRRSAIFPSDDDNSKDSISASTTQAYRSPIKVSKPNPSLERQKPTAEHLAQIKKTKEMELAKLARDKKRLGITPDIEPLSKKMKRPEPATNTPKKTYMAQFYPEAGVLVEIPVQFVQKLHDLKRRHAETKKDELLQFIERAKKTCLDNATRQHAETSNILDNFKKLVQVLESAQDKQKKSDLAASSITAMSAAASAGVTKEEAEKLLAEKEAKLKATQMRLEQTKALKEKEKKEKMIKAAAEASKTQNIGKGPLDSSEASSRILEKVEAKKEYEKKATKDDDEKGPRNAASRAALAAAEEDATLKAIGVPSLGEALKTFKIPKVNEVTAPTEEQPQLPLEKEKEPGIEKEKDRERGNEREQRDRGSSEQHRGEKDKDPSEQRYRDRGGSSRERDRDRSGGFDNFHGSRRYSSEYSDRKYEGDRRFSGEGGGGRYHDRYDDYPSTRGGYNDRRGGGGGYQQHRKHPRSPRGESYERRGVGGNGGSGGGGGHYPTASSNRGGRGFASAFRGGRGGNYRDTSREQWKGSSTSSTSAINNQTQHEEFYEGLPPKQQQLNREALDDAVDFPQGDPRFRHSSYEPNAIPPPFSAFSNPPARKVLLPNRIGESSGVRPSGWNQPTFFNQPPLQPGGVSAPLPSLLSGNKSTSHFPGQPSVSSSLLADRQQSTETARRLARPRDSRDSPPEIGLQIDESD